MDPIRQALFDVREHAAKHPFMNLDADEIAEDFSGGTDEEWAVYRGIVQQLVDARHALMAALRASGLTCQACAADLHRAAALSNGAFDYEAARQWRDALADAQTAMEEADQLDPSDYRALGSNRDLGVRE